MTRGGAQRGVAARARPAQHAQIIRNWRGKHLVTGTANAIVANNSSLGDESFRHWLSAEAEAFDNAEGGFRSPIFLVVPESTDVESLRDVLRSVRVGIEVLSLSNSDSDEADLETLVSDALVASSSTDEEECADDEADADRQDDGKQSPSLGAYLNPPHRLTDDAYASWFQRLRQDPKDRGD
jgi:hypothetical protein